MSNHPVIAKLIERNKTEWFREISYEESKELIRLFHMLADERDGLLKANGRLNFEVETLKLALKEIGHE